MKSFTQKYRATLIIVGAVLLALILLPWKTAPDSPLPAAIGSLLLVEQWSGQEARAIINRLHDKAITPGENYIGEYRSGKGSATLYVSVYERDELATEAEKRMASLIAAGNPYFGHYHQFIVDGKTIAMCLGMGQVHYFFSNRNLLYWLAADRPVAEESLHSFLSSLESLQEKS